MHTFTASIGAPLYFNVSIATVNAQLNSIKFTAYGNPSAISLSNPITSGNVSTYIQSAAIGFAQVGQLKTQNLEVGSVSARSITELIDVATSLSTSASSTTTTGTLATHVVPSGTTSVLGLIQARILCVINNTGTVPDKVLVSLNSEKTGGEILGSVQHLERTSTMIQVAATVYQIRTSIVIPFVTTLSAGSTNFTYALNVAFYNSAGNAFTPTAGGTLTLSTKTILLENKV